MAKKFKDELGGLYKDQMKDNDSIYHERIKSDEMVPIDAKVMAKSSKFEPPTAADIKIIQKNNSYFCCIS